MMYFVEYTNFVDRIYFNGRILKANLSWPQKKSNSSEVIKFSSVS